MEKTKLLYAKKYEMKQPGLHPDVFDLQGPDAIAPQEFSEKDHKTKHSEAFESKCQDCELEMYQDCINDLFKIMMLGQDPKKQEQDRQKQVRIA